MAPSDSLFLLSPPSPYPGLGAFDLKTWLVSKGVAAFEFEEVNEEVKGVMVAVWEFNFLLDFSVFFVGGGGVLGGRRFLPFFPNKNGRHLGVAPCLRCSTR